jgi:hypothetical protein
MKMDYQKEKNENLTIEAIALATAAFIKYKK